MKATLTINEIIFLSKDEFARWLFELGLNIVVYNFDLLYDIHKIMELLGQKRGNIDEVESDEYHLMLRDTGCDIVDPKNETYDTYFKMNELVYKIIFTWNEEYFTKTNFAEITRIK